MSTDAKTPLDLDALEVLEKAATPWEAQFDRDHALADAWLAERVAARALLARVLEQRAREQPTRDQIEALLSEHTERSETLLRDIRAAIGEG